MKYINKYNTVFHLVHHVHQLRRHRPPLLHPHKKPKGTTTTFELFKIISPLIISNFITEFHTCCWDSNILYNIFPLYSYIWKVQTRLVHEGEYGIISNISAKLTQYWKISQDLGAQTWKICEQAFLRLKISSFCHF